jgi:hypothetical protein|tara:strand:- start:504 stop:617 length:114 start_codon:yes stop_codon:yes gene_type:complete
MAKENTKPTKKKLKIDYEQEQVARHKYNRRSKKEKKS